MNRVYAFAAGIVTAGVAASLFAGNPNPPAGPIGPTMVTLDELAGLVACQNPKPWKSRVLKSDGSPTYVYPPQQVFAGSGAVRSISVIAQYSTNLEAKSGVWFLYDAATVDDLSTQIGAVYASSLSGDQVLNATLNLDATVEKGLVVVPATKGFVTVVFRQN